jgi:hypothetical protein
MIDGFGEKTPSEKKYFDADFAADLPSGDFITAPGVGSATTATVVDSAGVDKTATLIAAVTVSTTKVRVLLQGGADGMNYTLTVRAQMNAALTKFDRMFEIRVRSTRRTS